MPEYRDALAEAKEIPNLSILVFRIQELESLLFSERESHEHCRTDRENILHAHSLLDSDLIEAQEYIERLVFALRDCVSTYTGKDKLVTAERIEAWKSALKNPKFPQ